jgi:1,2-diacylglycerol-3-alpha-glucose alpha-1,2-galactosyltransferase
MAKITVNMVSESDISVQGHGVHTAYIEMAEALEARSDINVIRGDFGRVTDCDVVHVHSIGSRTYRKLLQKHTPRVISAHVVPASFIGSIVLARYWLFFMRWYLRWFYARAEKVLAVSQTVADSLHNDLGVPREKIEVFYNTIDMANYKTDVSDKKAARKLLKVDQKSFVVVGNGQVQPRKRLDVFVRMAKSLPDVQFVWVGGIPFKRLGADYSAMQTLMKNLPKNMRITGVVPHHAVKSYLAAADVFCLPAEQENHPMAVLEAAGSGLPIVIRDIAEYDDTFRHDAIRCSDDSFVDAVRRLRDDSKYYEDTKKGTSKIANRFDSANAAAKLVVLYRDLIGNHKTTRLCVLDFLQIHIDHQLTVSLQL